MSKLAERIYDRFFGKKTQTRRYAAARLNKQNANWTTYPTGANYERRLDLRALRARARQASRDDGHFKKFLSLTRSNIVGRKGIQLKCNARSADGSLNVQLNKQVTEAWKLWGHKETCTLSGKLNWRGVQRLVVTQWARDGEYLVQMLMPDPQNNPFGFTLKIWDVNWLDEMFNQTLSNGNRIIMSVEYDDDDKPVAYWLTTPASEINFTKRREVRRTRVPAEQIIHEFLIEDDESQARGVTWFHAALLKGKSAASYEEGVIQSARFAACSFGTLENSQEIDAAQFTGEDGETGQQILPDIDVSPASITGLPPGWHLNMTDPKQPTQNHAAFMKTIYMGLAAALDIPYFYLAGDMEAVNFSSSRVGLDDARDIWKGLQDVVAENFCRRVFHTWVRLALLNKQIKMSMKDFAEIQNPKWQARGWNYIDPTKDINADIMALANNANSLTRVLGEKGIDPIDLFEEIQAERELALKYGIELKYVTAVRVSDTGTAPENDAGAPADTPAPPETPPKREYTNGHAELVG